MAKKMNDVLLDRQWSGYEAGEIVTVETVTAESMVRKNYGRILSASEKKKLTAEKAPKIETATAPPQSESDQKDPVIETATAPPKAKTESKKGR